MATSEQTQRLTALLEEPVSKLGLDLEAVEITPAGKRRMLRVAVDKDDGVTMDEVAEATREVSRLLDESDVMGNQPYTLEVSSRGVDRPLTLPRHWRRNAGRKVLVNCTDGSTLEGRIGTSEDAEDGAVTLVIDGDDHRLPYADVRKAKVQIEFNSRARD
jgi:ribosome maturation factor RimP